MEFAPSNPIITGAVMFDFVPFLDWADKVLQNNQVRKQLIGGSDETTVRETSSIIHMNFASLAGRPACALDTLALSDYFKLGEIFFGSKMPIIHTQEVNKLWAMLERSLPRCSLVSARRFFLLIGTGGREQVTATLIKYDKQALDEIPSVAREGLRRVYRETVFAAGFAEMNDLIREVRSFSSTDLEKMKNSLGAMTL